jgi:DNA primase
MQMDYFGLRNSFDADWGDAFNAQYSLHAVVSQYTQLIRRGAEYVGRCPFPDHRDSKPSFSMNEGKGLFHCFGCNRGGNAVSFLQIMHGLSHTDACRELQSGGVVPSIADCTLMEDSDEKSRRARDIWNEALPIIGTPVAEYVDGRALPFEFVSQQENIRFARLSFDRSAKRHPAIVAAARNLDGEIVAIQRIYLTEEGKKLSKDCKRSFGPTRGAAIRLHGASAPLADPDRIVLCEGLEDGLSIARCHEDAVVWVTMGTPNLPQVELPQSCRTVVIAHDNDDAGRAAAAVAAERFSKAGLTVELDPPPPGFKDWNEYLSHWEFSTDMFGNDLEWLRVDEEDIDEAVMELPSLGEVRGYDF